MISPLDREKKKTLILGCEYEEKNKCVRERERRSQWKKGKNNAFDAVFDAEKPLHFQ